MISLTTNGRLLRLEFPSGAVADVTPEELLSLVNNMEARDLARRAMHDAKAQQLKARLTPERNGYPVSGVI
jgi:hypothetical protein